MIYARYSSDNQREESIEGQIRECKAYAEFNDIKIVDTYIDRALSAKTDDRPQFQQMIKDSYAKGFDIVLVWKLDRFSRDRYDSAHYKRILKKNGAKVVSATEKISNGAEGILLESLLEGVAEYYSAELAEKVKRGMKDNALKCKWNGGHIPLGYKVNRDEHRLEVEPESAKVIKLIYQMASEEHTIRDIFRYLEEKKILNSNGDPIPYNVVRKILSNRLYIGEYSHCGVVVENGIPAIIDRSLFEAVQIELKKNSNAPARHTAKEDYLLTTKLFCAKCGAMMVAQAGTSKMGNLYRYYACVRQKKHLCDKKMLPKEKFENYVVYKTMQFLEDDSVIEELSARLYDLQEEESSLVPKLKMQASEKEKEIENIVSAIQKGIASEALMRRLTLIEEEKREIEVSIAKEEVRSPMFSQDEFRMALTNFRKIDITTFEGKRRIIDTFINSIYVDDDHIRIIYNGKIREECITLDELQSSTMFSSGPPNIKDAERRLLCLSEKAEGTRTRRERKARKEKAPGERFPPTRAVSGRGNAPSESLMAHQTQRTPRGAFCVLY